MTSMQLILDFALSGVTNDRTLGGPTSEMWIDPWIAHLQSRGVQLEANVAVDGLDLEGIAALDDHLDEIRLTQIIARVRL